MHWKQVTVISAEMSDEAAYTIIGSIDVQGSNGCEKELG